MDPEIIYLAAISRSSSADSTNSSNSAIIQINSSDSTIEVINLASSDTEIIHLDSSDTEIIHLDSSDGETSTSDQQIDSTNSLEDWLSGSDLTSDSTYQPSNISLKSLSTNPQFSWNTLPRKKSVSFATADALELFEPEVPPVVYTAIFQNSDLGSLTDSCSFDTDLESYISDLQLEPTKTNSQIIEEQREVLNFEWDQFESTFSQHYPEPYSLSVKSKYYREATQKKLEIANKWWNLINKYTVPQPAPPLALEL